MPAKSQAQFKLMKGICEGSIKPKRGITRKVACEYVRGQSPKGLPKRAKKRKSAKKRRKKSAKRRKRG